MCELLPGNRRMQCGWIADLNPISCFPNSNCSAAVSYVSGLASACSRVPLQKFRNGEFANPTALVRHQHRQVSVLHDVAGGAAKDHLPQPVAREGPLDQEIAAFRPGGI